MTSDAPLADAPHCVTCGARIRTKHRDTEYCHICRPD